MIHRATTPETAQSVTVVQPAPSAMTANIGSIGAWAGAVIAIAGVVAILYKLLTREIVRDIKDVSQRGERDIKDVDHKLANVRSRVDSLENLRHADVERIVKLETSAIAIEKSLDRIDTTINERFDQLAESIREIRVVRPR